jgi:predicted ATP-grasp superfamily ATP-dependent carboligase
MIDIQPAIDLVIIGASTRAAAFSAMRAGYHPLCIDLFGDLDLQAHATVHRIGRDPDDLLHLLRTLPSSPILYCGGLENRPEILRAAAAHHQLWGNPEESVSRVRDPAKLAEATRLAKFNLPEWRNEDSPPPADGTWLLKPRSSAGGRGICLWTQEQAHSMTLQEPHVFQKRIVGESYSATFIGSALVGDVRFVGMTRQLIGLPECHARPFQWCGNIGPAALPVSIENLIRRLGNVLKWKMELRGLFGLDFILDPDGVPWITEVNPRYPGSVELLEHATGCALLRDHILCFTDENVPPVSWARPHPGELLGKAILYAPKDLIMQQPLADASQIPYDEFPAIADLPAIGQKIHQGEPVCTLFAESESADQTLQLLQEQLTNTTERLLQCSQPAPE